MKNGAGISTEMWMKILEDGSLATQNAIPLFQKLYAKPHRRSTASELGEALGFPFVVNRRSLANPTINLVRSFGRRLRDEYQISASKPGREDWYWIFPFYSGPRPPEGGWPPGQPPIEEYTSEQRFVTNPHTGERKKAPFFIWVLRPNLAEALEQLNLVGDSLSIAPTDEAKASADPAEVSEEAAAAIPVEFREGALKRRWVNAYERDDKARAACVAHHGARCQACGFDFAQTYGPLGAGFTHVHHVVPLAQIRQSYKVDPIRDLIPLCPNCHAMIHRGAASAREAMTLEDLRALIAEARKA